MTNENESEMMLGWDCDNFECRCSHGDPKLARKAFFATLEELAMKVPGPIVQNVGAIVAGLVEGIERRGVRVNVRVEARHFIQHTCGAVFTPEEWRNLPEPVRHHRECVCGETATYGQLTLVHERVES